MAKNDWVVVDEAMTVRIGCAVGFFSTKTAAQGFVSALNGIAENDKRIFFADRADRIFTNGKRPLLMPADAMPKLPG